MSVSARLRSVGVLAAVWLLSGCYYGQVIHGQMSLLADRQPIDQVLAELEPSAPLYQQLQVARDARRFAVTELRLPDNASYTGYVALDRPYPVWTVTAAPRLSLQAKQWCYPLLGCVGYRGHFEQQAALRLADELRAGG